AYSILESLSSIGKVKQDGSGYSFNFGGKVHRVEESELDEFFDSNKKLLDQLHAVYKKSMGIGTIAFTRSRE
ncbi:MAG TPA: hypothetical protein VI583_11715, partial [Cyclobacteriaceae bacterium]|nr:hypothetical protein [Cyclobacteriaceae bacterium]